MQLNSDSKSSTNLASGLFGFGLVMAASAFILWNFYDRFWCAPDEGAYAYVAERILAGDVLNRDIQDIHFGLVNFSNAMAMHLFGHSLLSLRYPLVLMCWLQTGVVYWLIWPRGQIPAVVGSLCVASLSLIQFLNPTAHWYCLFFSIVLIGALTWIPKTHWSRMFVVGMLVAIIFMYRQLTGVLVSIAVVTYLLQEHTVDSPRGKPWLAWGLCGIMLLGLGGYLWGKNSPQTFLFYGTWPLIVIGLTAARTSISNLRVLKWSLFGTLGAACAIAPLVCYHVDHNSVDSWLADTVHAAFGLTELNWFQDTSFPSLTALVMRQTLRATSIQHASSGSFWLASFWLPIVLGASVVMHQSRNRKTISALPVLAIFYSIVSLHYQITIYLFFSLSLIVVGLIYLTSSTRWLGRLSCSMAVVLCVFGIYHQAAQPLNRTVDEIFRGERVERVVRYENPRCGLLVHPESQAVYQQVVGLIQRETSKQDLILALPVNPELYFLSQRRAPVRFFNSSLGIRSQRQLEDVMDTLKRDPPKLVIYRPNDKYITSFCRNLMIQVRQRYDTIAVIGEFEVYRLRRASSEGLQQIASRSL